MTFCIHEIPAAECRIVGCRTLTTRQLEVAGLVARGLTDTAIARTLGITRRTVTHHIVAAFDKLGIDNRIALALWYVGRDAA